MSTQPPNARRAPRLLFCGDIHGHADHILEAVAFHRPAAVILLGDVQAPCPLDQMFASIADRTALWFIPGNHDTDSDADYDHLWGSAWASRNLHGRVVTIAGLRVAGLGGVFRGHVWDPRSDPAFDSPEDFLKRGGKGTRWRGGLVRKHHSTIFPSDIRVFRGQRADILVTHEAPDCHPMGVAPITALAQSLGVRHSFHGHHHDCLDYRAATGRLGFQAHGVGFCGISDEEGNVLYPGDFDAVHADRCPPDTNKRQGRHTSNPGPGPLGF